MAFANQFGIDLPGIGGALDQRRANALQQLVLKGQVDAQQADTAGRNALAAYFGGDQSQLGPAMAYKPEAVANVQGRQAALDKDARERMAKEAPVFGRLFSGVQDQASYDQARQAAESNGLNVAKLPPQFDPGIVQRIVATANAFAPKKLELKEFEDGVYEVAEDGTRTKTDLKPKRNRAELDNLIAARDALPEGDPRRKIYDNAIAKQTERSDPLEEIYDPNSPTGTRKVPRADAANKPGVPKSGLKLTTNPDGSIELVQGAGLPGPNSVAKPVQSKIDESLLDLQSRSDRLNLVAAQYKPEYLQMPAQVTNWATAQLERFGLEQGPQAKQRLTEYTKFRSDAANELTQTLKAMSGAAVTPQEAERLLKAIGNVDEDSPTQFKAKLDSTIRYVNLAKARLRHVKNNGLGEKGLTDIPLDNMQNIINQKGDELNKQFRANGYDDVQAVEQTKRALRQEYGI